MANLGLYTQIRGKEDHQVLKHLGLVRRVAMHLKPRIPPLLEVDELVQIGMIAVVEAMASFNPEKLSDFEAYALKRIRGAMLDEVRRLSVHSRYSLDIRRRHEDAAGELRSSLGRAPRQLELAAHLGLNEENFQAERNASALVELVSMELAEEEVLKVEDDRQNGPEQITSQKQLIEKLAAAIEQLSERDRLIMALYYSEELNLKEIGAIMELSESRISQILSALLKQLRSLLNPS